MHGAMLVGRVCRLRFLDILRKNDARWRALGECYTERTINDVTQLRRRGNHLHIFLRNVLEQCNEVDLLLKLSSERGPRFLSHDRDNGLISQVLRELKS